MAGNVFALVILVLIRVAIKKPKRQFWITCIFAVFFAGGFLNIVSDETASWALGIVVAFATHFAVLKMKEQKPAQAPQQHITTPPVAAKPATPVTKSVTPATPVTKAATTGSQAKPPVAPKPSGKQVTDVLHTCVRCARPLTQAQCSNCGYNHEKNMFYTLCPVSFE